MKTKFFFALSLLVAVVMSSCNSEDNLQVSNDNETAEQILMEINKNNPMSFVGLKHNEELEKMSKALREISRSGEYATKAQYDSVTRAQAEADYLEAIQNLATEDGVSHATIEEFDSIFDGTIDYYRYSYAQNFQNLDSLYNSLFDRNQKQCYNELRNIMNAENTDLRQILQQIQQLDNLIDMRITNQTQRDVLHSFTSIAANSTYYWSLHQDEILPPVQDGVNMNLTTRDYLDVARVDFRAGKFVYNILKHFGGIFSTGSTIAIVGISAGACSLGYALNR